jgi:hypothetical protein
MCMVSTLRSPQACVCSVSSLAMTGRYKRIAAIIDTVTTSSSVDRGVTVTVHCVFQFDTASCWQSFLHRTPHKHSFNMLKLL